MKPNFLSKKLSLIRALSWIVGSTILISGGGYSLLKHALNWKQDKILDPNNRIVAIVQTGPQKEALKTVYLAELIGISIDRPTSIFRFDARLAEKRLLQSPVIKEAHVKIMKPGAVYVDYTARQPIAWVYDFENAAIDEEGYLFPVHPFFTPKKLPEIYLGLAPFGILSEDPDRAVAEWGFPRQDKYTKLALALLKMVSDSPHGELFHIHRIDVSNAYAESFGVREIVLIAEDQVVLRENEREVVFVFPRILRLSTKNYAQELGNYLQLRDQLLQQEQQQMKIPNGDSSLVRMTEKVIDFRIPRLAFIDQK
ncbi:MAG TPA: hypothetical protein VLG49_00855 [Rhabdochlamydiaceae bacterium]|nr:hypothetical protein [Rhabdochlamydiaceae bacterium]